MAFFLFQLGSPQQGIDLARHAATHWASRNQQGPEAKARAHYAWLLLELGSSEEAIEEAAQALKLAELANDTRILSLATNVLGVVFWMSRQLDRAMELCARATDLAREVGDSIYECWWMINLGCVWAEVGHFALDSGDTAAARGPFLKAVEITDRAYRLAIANDDPWAERLCLGNNADYYTGMGDTISAAECLTKYAKVKGHNYTRGMEQYYYTLGQALVAEGRYPQAIENLKEAILLANLTGNIETLLQANNFLSKAYEKQGCYQEALEAHKEYHQLALHLAAERAQHKARLAEIHYETRKLRNLAASETQRAEQFAASFRILEEKAAQLTEAALVDPLTNLCNRRHLDMILTSYRDDIQRPFVLAMIDVDHFKRINDTFTHVVGDKVLAEIGRLLRRHIRSTDTAARFGGEEFLLVFDNAELADACNSCERLRRVILERNWDEIEPGLQVSVSIGLADGRAAGSPFLAIEAADRNLYTAKRLGRNQVIPSQG
ncbi:GGDEF domain-containing protein [Oryzibacter oryziterrae]|uniref:GGDEF domain-containing protein n=1 Tax=Oryzibacter oryziterrae TaxID=2766474 RepID=UPI001F22EE7B|nr:tetratricopeptide repeat-containing diguanylate cyclase [Oryzibacter oryziterrae]